MLAPPRDDGLLYAVYVDGEEILRCAQDDIENFGLLGLIGQNSR